MKNFLLVFGAVACWLQKSDGARILTVMAIHAPSHHIWFSSLAVALAEKGHEVYSIDFKLPKKHPPSLKVDLLAPLDPAAAENLAHLVRVLQKGTLCEKFSTFAKQVVNSCKTALGDKAIQKIISPDFKEKFDVIIFSYNWQECLFGLIHRFNNTPAILAAPFPLPVPLLRNLGNPIFHGIPHYLQDFPLPMNFLQRLRTLLLYLYDEFIYYTEQEARMDEILKNVFGKDCPPVSELVKHVALGFVNIMDTKPRPPLVANIIPVNGMHIPPVEPLSKDLKEFLDGARDGAVIMSFGSLVRGDGIGDDKVAAVLKVFSKLPQRLLWKYESAGDEKLANVPPNIKLLSWLPQNDLLAHPNVRLFISHCGGMSTTEAAFHGIPILGTPFMIDQYSNMEQVLASGLGLQLPLSELTEETLHGNLTELLNNPKYYEIAQRTKLVMQDQLVKPIDRAVFYVEYVARHRGAPHLRSPIADLPHGSRTIIFDIASVVAVLTLVLVALAVLLFKVLCALKSALFKTDQPTHVTSSKKNR